MKNFISPVLFGLMGFASLTVGIAGCSEPGTSGLDGLDRLDIMQTIVQEYLRPAKECMVGQLGNGTELESAYINKYS